MIGKHAYANVPVNSTATLEFEQFAKEGAFEQWQKGKDRAYF